MSAGKVNTTPPHEVLVRLRAPGPFRVDCPLPVLSNAIALSKPDAVWDAVGDEVPVWVRDCVGVGAWDLVSVPLSVAVPVRLGEDEGESVCDGVSLTVWLRDCVREAVGAALGV